MGTSKDVSGATTREWSRLKRRATLFARDGGPEASGRVVDGLIGALGGAVGALQASPSAIRTGQALMDFFAGVGAAGITPTLEELGLGTLVGRPRLEVLSELADTFAGDGATLEEVAARQAAIFVLDQTLPAEGDPLDFGMDAAAIELALRMFIARYIYCRLDVWLAERLARLADPEERARRDAEIWDYIFAATQLQLEGTDLLATDWRSAEGRSLMERLLGGIYTDLEATQ